MSVDRPIGPQVGSEEYKKIKEQINAEGFQAGDDGESDGAVFIGTREEIDAARLKAETEGRTPDLASYLRMHKHIVATPENMLEIDKWRSDQMKTIKPDPITDSFGYLQKGAAVLKADMRLYYKDAEGNLARVDIDPTKIAELAQSFANEANPGAVKGLMFGKIARRLEEMGFNILTSVWQSTAGGNEFPEAVENWMDSIRQQKARIEKNKGFDF